MTIYANLSGGLGGGATYSTGSFTPTLTGSSSNPNVPYTNQIGQYVKVGKMVFVSIYLSWSGASGGNGNGQISGFPFASSSITNLNQLIMSTNPDFFSTWAIYITPGSTFGTVINGSGAVSVATLTGSNPGPLTITGTYLADA